MGSRKVLKELPGCIRVKGGSPRCQDTALKNENSVIEYTNCYYLGSPSPLRRSRVNGRTL